MKNVLLVFGGKSYEHDISVVTASQIYNKTRIQDVKLVLFYVSREGNFFIYEGDKFVLSDFAKSKFSAENKKFKQVSFVSGEKGVLFVKSFFGLKEYMKVDTAIFACHGRDGENGKLVSLFESVGIGCSAGSFEALGICMNKYLFKQVMRGLKIPTVLGFKVSKTDAIENPESVYEKLKKLGFPVIIKANSGGSSIGVFVAKTQEEFIENLQAAFEFDREVVVEKLIEETREFNIAVLGNSEEFKVSDIDEPIKVHEVLTFGDKYLSGNGKNCGKMKMQGGNSMASQARKFPADLTFEQTNKLKGYALKIFESLGLTGVVRIDFLMDCKTGKFYVCEVNSIPGSLAYYFFNENKLLVNDLSLRLIKIAEDNRKKLNDFKIDFCTEILEKSSL